MARARYQVLVIPYCITDGQVRFCAFRRKDLDIWQFIAGGGEDEDASIIESARREAFEDVQLFAARHLLQHPGGLLPGCGSAVGPRLLCRPRIRIRSQGRKYVSAAVPRTHRIRMGSVRARLCNAAIRQQPDRPVGTEPTLGAGSAKLTAACRCHVSKAGAQEHKTEDV